MTDGHAHEAPTADEVKQLFSFFAELDSLTRLPRLGWIFVGIDNPEHVSDHCYQTALIAYFFARSMHEPVDVSKVLLMTLFHETAEARFTDLPRRASRYLGKENKHKAEERVLNDFLAPVGPELVDLLREFHECQTLEARVAEAAEEFQIVLKAYCYARLNRGQLTEYLGDIEKYDPLGVPLAAALRDVLRERMRRLVVPLDGDLP